MGSVQQNAQFITLEAGEVLAAADIGRGGVYNTSGQVVAAGAGVYPDVIIRDVQATVGNGVPCTHVQSSMRVSVTLAATVTVGQLLATDAAGDFIVSSSGDETCLKAMFGGATGETITALVVAAQVIA
jgi:hypothetical protein